MKVAFLTSSRADFGIYLPLLQAMGSDDFFDVRIIAFGTHLSSFHGHTIEAIIAEGFAIDYQVETVLASDTAASISSSMALTGLKFAAVWEREKENYDLVFCLGDRYEMFAAVSAAAPFNMRFAHLHGGETTMGAIDNEFRHCLTIFSVIHFTATDDYAKRVAQIKGCNENVYAVGSLSLDNLPRLHFLSARDFEAKFSINLLQPSILVTYHPETVSVANNRRNAENLVSALDFFKEFQVIITMPNADTMGNAMREVYLDFATNRSNVFIVESFGTEGYFSCMNLCSLVVGNSSSGIIEAASFGKYVVNIGDRQKGRAVSENVIHCQADNASIIKACKDGLTKGRYTGTNIYFKENVAKNIIEILKNGSRKSL